MSIKVTNARTGERIELTQADFKFQGGEGQVFIRGDVVYKVCDPGKMIPVEKIKELAILDHPKIMRPEDVLLERKKPVGYTIRLVPSNPQPLAKILPKGYRERENVTPKHMLALVQQLRDGVQFYHDHKCLRVDGNEYNYMVTDDFQELYFIDVNSDQTPNFPCSAIMANIQDYQANGHWTELSDWYSFCILSWFMFTAIHPYKAWNPVVKSPKTAMLDCMMANKSVLDPESQFPQGAIYMPFEDFVPGGKNGAYMQWYRAILLDGKRLAPPKTYQDTLGVVVVVRKIIGTNNFEIYELHDYKNLITGFYQSKGREVVVTKENVFVNKLSYPLPAKRFRVAFTALNNFPVAVYVEDQRLKLFDFESQSLIPVDVGAEDIMSYGGRVYVKCGQEISQVSFVETPGTIMLAGVKKVAPVLEHATELYQGVAIQQIFGTYYIDLFPNELHRHIKIPELDGYRIIDAKAEANVLMVVVQTKDGRYDRLIFRFDVGWDSYDTRVVENVPHADIDFTVLDTGVVASITEEEKLELFSTRKGASTTKVVEDPVLKADMRLCHTVGTQFAQGSRMFSIKLRS